MPHAPPVHDAVQRRCAWSRRAWVRLLLLPLVLVSCTQLTPDPPGSPVISSFAADPALAAAGTSVTLSWTVLGADTLRLKPGGIDVTGAASFAVSPAATTTYTLVAENEVGSANASVTVTIGDLARIESFDADGPPVNPGLPASLSWSVTDADTLWLVEPGTGDRIDVMGTTSYAIDMALPGAYTLVAGASAGEVEAVAFPARDVPAFTALVVGQSNAQGVNLAPDAARAFIEAADGVMMLGNDDVWKAASEPLDDCVDQVDTESMDPSKGCAVFEDNNSGVSFGVSLGNRLAAANGGEVFLIPAAKGGSSLAAWAVGDPTDRETLFGNAVVRAQRAGPEQAAPIDHTFEGADYGAVVWYQGESDTATSDLANAYGAKTDAVLDGFQAELGAPVILVQLGRRGDTGTPSDPEPPTVIASRNLLYQRVREAQRTLAAGSQTPGGAPASMARSETFLVVTHDLPMAAGDGRHLSAAGQVELGRRIALSVREHLWGEAVDGTGPRLEQVVQVSSTVIEVQIDRPVTAPDTSGASAYDGYFAVFSGGVAVPIQSVSLKSGAPSVIRIVLAESGPNAVVRYMPPPGRISGFVDDVVRAASCSEPRPGTAMQCLPLPAFGASAEAATLQRLEFFIDTDPAD